MTEMLEYPEHRAAAYRLLAEVFRFPRGEDAQRFRTGCWGREIEDHLAALGLVDAGGAPLRLDNGAGDYEVEYIGLFEVGMGGAPCPLHSGYYGRDRMRDLEEVVRFYRFFGYEPQRTSDRFPDHLVFELEFMAHLIGKERDAGSLESVRLAERDFCSRHLASWIPQLRAAVEKRAANPFIKGAVRLTDLLVAGDCRELSDARHKAVPATRNF